VVRGVTLVTHELFVRLSFVTADRARTVFTQATGHIIAMVTLSLVYSCTHTHRQTDRQTSSDGDGSGSSTIVAVVVAVALGPFCHTPGTARHYTRTLMEGR